MRLNAYDKEILEKLKENIVREMKQRHSIESMALFTGMSRSRFKIAFKQHFKQTPLKLITELKMQHALTLLQEDRLSLGQVAKAVGYRYPANFITTFKNFFGYTPGAARPSA